MFDHLCRGLRDRGVSDVADLAVIFVVRVGVPVADCVRGKKSQRENCGDSQQASGDSFRHLQLDGHIETYTTANSALRATIGFACV